MGGLIWKFGLSILGIIFAFNAVKIIFGMSNELTDYIAKESKRWVRAKLAKAEEEGEEEEDVEEDEEEKEKEE